MSSIAPSAHTRGLHSTDSWITPKWLIDRIGPFDLDPCACVPQPWPCAARSYTENGLLLPWDGFVWMNPPYGRALGDWLNRLADHGSGIALVFARTETDAFFSGVFGRAASLLFLRGRLTFHFPDGSPAPHNSGGPSVLVGYGALATERLAANADLGAFVELKVSRKGAEAQLEMMR